MFLFKKIYLLAIIYWLFNDLFKNCLIIHFYLLIYLVDFFNDIFNFFQFVRYLYTFKKLFSTFFVYKFIADVATFTVLTPLIRCTSPAAWARETCNEAKPRLPFRNFTYVTLFGSDPTWYSMNASAVFSAST